MELLSKSLYNAIYTTKYRQNLGHAGMNPISGQPSSKVSIRRFTADLFENLQ
jgi:hypothetical protein